MLFLISPREVFFACLPSFPRNLPSFSVESTPSFPCSRSNPPLSRQGAALAYLDSPPYHDLVIWTDGSVSFPFNKGGSGVLANCSLCGTEAALSFSAGPVCSIFSLKPAPFYKLSAGLDTTNNSAISFLSSDFRSVLATLSSPPTFLLPQTLW